MNPELIQHIPISEAKRIDYEVTFRLPGEVSLAALRRLGTMKAR
jgi:hypothetical protein